MAAVSDSIGEEEFVVVSAPDLRFYQWRRLCVFGRSSVKPSGGENDETKHLELGYDVLPARGDLNCPDGIGSLQGRPQLGLSNEQDPSPEHD